MCSVLSLAPLDLIDLLLDLQRLEVVELWFVRLELGVELVLAILFLWERDAAHGGRTGRVSTPRSGRPSGGRGAYHLIALEQDDTAALVAGREVVACRVELDGGDDVGCGAGRDKTLGGVAREGRGAGRTDLL